MAKQGVANRLSRERFFAQFADGPKKTIVCLQTDLSNHSKWFYSCAQDRSAYQATQAKAELARRFDEALEQLAFYRLSWEGDGGRYVATEDERPGGFGFVVEAADRVFQEFARWKRQYQTLGTDRLEIRVSADQFPVYTDTEPGFWTSEGLNRFAKNEREIAIAGAFVITEALAGDLRNYGNRFRTVLPTPLPFGDPAVSLYVDASHCPTAPETAGMESLSTFLRNLARKLRSGSECEIGPAVGARVRIGGGVFLDGVVNPDQPYNVELEPADKEMETSFKPSEQKVVDRWARSKRREIRARGEEDRWYVNPVVISNPVPGLPLCKILWKPCRYSAGWAAQAFVRREKNKEAWSRAAQNALSPGGRRLPSRLTVQGIILTQPEDWGNGGLHTAGIILAQRNSARAVALEFDKWSASFEEGVIAGRGSRPGKPESVEMAALRGLLQEFGIMSSIRPRLLGVQLERGNLSVGVSAIVEVPMSYKEVEESWRTHARDRGEHVQIAALPLDEDLIRKCVKTGSLQPAKRQMKHAGTRFNRCGNWNLHPTAALRLAEAVWFKCTWT